jgi:hypothetical protein
MGYPHDVVLLRIGLAPGVVSNVEFRQHRADFGLEWAGDVQGSGGHVGCFFVLYVISSKPQAASRKLQAANCKPREELAARSS